MTKSTTFTFRVSPEVKKQSAELYESLGITLSDAINLFLHQSLVEGGLPFEVKRDKIKQGKAKTQVEIKRGLEVKASNPLFLCSERHIGIDYTPCDSCFNTDSKCSGSGASKYSSSPVRGCTNPSA